VDPSILGSCLCTIKRRPKAMSTTIETKKPNKTIGYALAIALIVR
jgi:hypothetical protein